LGKDSRDNYPSKVKYLEAALEQAEKAIQIVENSLEASKELTYAEYLYRNAIIMQLLMPHIQDEGLRGTYRIKAGDYYQLSFKLNEKLLPKLAKSLRSNKMVNVELLWDLWVLSENSKILRDELIYVLGSVTTLKLRDIVVKVGKYI
jgi:hypothetical protein